MLLRQDATYVDQVTGQLQRVFPVTESWLSFRSDLPSLDVLKDSVLDPAVGSTDDLSIKRWVNADWSNWVQTVKVATFEIGTRIGLPALPQLNSHVASVFTDLSESLTTSLANFDRMSTPALIEDVLKQAGAATVNALAMSGNPVALVVAAVVQGGIWIADVVASYKSAELAKNVTLPPLQTADPATDAWQVNRVYELFRLPAEVDVGAALPDGSVITAGNANMTRLFLPAYRSSDAWTVAWRDQGLVAGQGSPGTHAGPTGPTAYPFMPSGAFGFMPGTDRMLRTLQASYRYYQTLRAGIGVDRYNIRCNAVDRGCGESVKAFDGGKDCRQCVTGESVWPTQGVGWAYGGLPINATTPGDNTGEFHISTNKLIGTIQQWLLADGPLTWCVDAEMLHYAWQQTFENFWTWMPGAWQQYRGVGWRGLLTRLASFMVAFPEPGVIPRVGSAPNYILGGRIPEMPANVLVDPRTSHAWELSFEHSIFKRVIEPFLFDLYRYQQERLEGIEVAYVPPLAASVFKSNGQIRSSPLGAEFEARRRELLQTSARMLVDLELVSDLEYRDALVASGVRPKITRFDGPTEIASDTPKAIPPRLRVSMPPLAGLNQLVERARRVSASTAEDGGGGGWLLAALGLGAAVGLGTLALRRGRRRR